MDTQIFQFVDFFYILLAIRFVLHNLILVLYETDKDTGHFKNISERTKHSTKIQTVIVIIKMHDFLFDSIFLYLFLSSFLLWFCWYFNTFISHDQFQKTSQNKKLLTTPKTLRSIKSWERIVYQLDNKNMISKKLLFISWKLTMYTALN